MIVFINEVTLIYAAVLVVLYFTQETIFSNFMSSPNAPSKNEQNIRSIVLVKIIINEK